MIQNVLNYLMTYASEHGVNPYIFLTIYIISIPVFYYPLTFIRKYREDSNKDQRLLAKYILKGIIISGSAWLAPYFYLLFFGKGLPLWLQLVIIGFVLINMVFIVRRFRKG